MLFKSLFLGIAALVFIFTGITDVVFRISTMLMYNLLDDSGADAAIALTKLVRSLGWVKIGRVQERLSSVRILPVPGGSG